MRRASSPAPPGPSTAVRCAPSGTETATRKTNGGKMTANKNYQWLLIGVLSLHFGVVFFDRNAFSFLTPYIQPDLKLSLTQIGLIGGGFSLAWALTGLVMGSLSDRFGHRKAI